MRGADLEPTHVLLEHLVDRLARASRQAAALPDDAGWALGADLDALGGVAEIIRGRHVDGRRRP
jgi:hypothetical protein